MPWPGGGGAGRGWRREGKEQRADWIPPVTAARPRRREGQRACERFRSKEGWCGGSMGARGSRCPRLCEADLRARPLRPEESGSGHGPCGLSTPPEGKKGSQEGWPFCAGVWGRREAPGARRAIANSQGQWGSHRLASWNAAQRACARVAAPWRNCQSKAGWGWLWRWPASAKTRPVPWPRASRAACMVLPLVVTLSTK